MSQSLKELQELRDSSESRKKDMQEKIDSHFLKNPPKKERKKRQKRQNQGKTWLY